MMSHWQVTRLLKLLTVDRSCQQIVGVGLERVEAWVRGQHQPDKGVA